MTICITHDVCRPGTGGDPHYTVYVRGVSLLLTRNELETLGRMVAATLQYQPPANKVDHAEERGIYVPGF